MQEYVESVVSAFSNLAKSLKFKVFFSFLLFVRKKVVSLQKETEKKKNNHGTCINNALRRADIGKHR
jgi:hypothetical protein